MPTLPEVPEDVEGEGRVSSLGDVAKDGVTSEQHSAGCDSGSGEKGGNGQSAISDVHTGAAGSRPPRPGNAAVSMFPGRPLTLPPSRLIPCSSGETVSVGDSPPGTLSNVAMFNTIISNLPAVALETGASIRTGTSFRPLCVCVCTWS